MVGLWPQPFSRNNLPPRESAPDTSTPISLNERHCKADSRQVHVSRETRGTSRCCSDTAAPTDHAGRTKYCKSVDPQLRGSYPACSPDPRAGRGSIAARAAPAGSAPGHRSQSRSHPLNIVLPDEIPGRALSGLLLLSLRRMEQPSLPRYRASENRLGKWETRGCHNLTGRVRRVHRTDVSAPMEMQWGAAVGMLTTRSSAHATRKPLSCPWLFCHSSMSSSARGVHIPERLSELRKVRGFEHIFRPQGDSHR
jgi:hypothetical protein